MPFAAPARSAPVRVGFVVHVMQVAGAEVLVRETVRRLGSRIHPTIFCLDAIGPIGEELRADGVDVVCLGRRPGWDFSASRRLAAEATTRRIEVLHAHQYGPELATVGDMNLASAARLLRMLLERRLEDSRSKMNALQLERVHPACEIFCIDPRRADQLERPCRAAAF